MRNLRCLGFFLLLPLVVGVPVSQEDSTEMNIKIAAGRGSYAYITRGCEGQVLSEQDVSFKDLGFSVDYQVKSPVQVGLRAGKIWDEYKYAVYTDGIGFEERPNTYLNPNASIEGRWLGIGGGYFFAKRHLPNREDRWWARHLPSWHLRIGKPRFYFSIQMLENVPLYSGGGYINLGFGGIAGRQTRYWLGLGTSGPYDGTGFVAQTNFKLKGSWYLDLTGRVGASEGSFERAISAGLNYRL